MTDPDQHLASLDAFRGLAVAGMILVNNPGNWNAVYPPLSHADWNGCTLADLVFPFFIVIMGAALAFAIGRRLDHGHAAPAIHNHIVQRAVALVGLGLVLNAVAAYPMFQAIRIPGVLQRIGVVYLLAAIVAIYAKPWQRTVIIAALLLGHWALLVFLPWHPPGLPFAPRMNVSGVIDRAVFGRHILTPTGDPEGILGTLPSVASALIGLTIGEYVRGHQRERHTNLALTLGGLVVFAAGLAWSIVLPLNKNLWTGSFVLVTAGLAMIALAALHYVIDVHGWKRWAGPFLWLGFNPLVVYFLSECFGHIVDYPVLHIAGKVTTARTWMYWDTLRPVLGRLSEEGMSLTYATLVVLVWTSVAGYFYQKHWRFRL